MTNLIDRNFVRESTIMDIDESLLLWLKEIGVYVIDKKNNKSIVDVHMASGEKWTALKNINKQKQRDNNNALKLPIISVRRTNFENEQDVWALGRFQKSISYSKIVDSTQTQNRANLKSNRMKNNLIMHDKVPVFQMIEIPYPKFIKVNYSVIVWTNYMLDLNMILEQIWFARDDQASGTNQIQIQSRNGNKYLLLVDPLGEDGSNIEEYSDVERIIRTTLSFKVLGYLIKEGQVQGFQKSIPCVSHIDIGDERLITNQEEIEKIFGK